MSLLTVLFMLGIGLILLLSGYRLYQSFLPIFYGLFGAVIGYNLVQAFRGEDLSNLSPLSLLIIASTALLLLALAYPLQKFGQLVIGALVGANAGLMLANYFNTGAGTRVLLALICLVVGAILATTLFRLMVVCLTAYIGADLLVTAGTFLVSGTAGSIDFAVNNQGGVTFLIIFVLTLIGIVVQYGSKKTTART